MTHSDEPLFTVFYGCSGRGYSKLCTRHEAERLLRRLKNYATVRDQDNTVVGRRELAPEGTWVWWIEGQEQADKAVER